MINKQLTFAVPTLFALALFTADPAQAALIFGANLIQNPGAEATSGAPITNTNNGTEVVPDWMTTGNFSVVHYTTVPNSVPLVTDPGPINRGDNFFAGGINTDPNAPANLAIGNQIDDVSNIAGLIDSGSVPFALSAYLGGYFDQRDNAMLTAVFQNSAMMSLGSATIGPVTEADRSDTTGLFLRSTMGFIPVGTRSIDFKLTLTGIDGNQNDGYADNLSFIATNPNGSSGVPEPGSVGMLATGLVAISLGLRSKRRKAN